MIDISNSSSMLEDWNKGVSCVGQSVQDVEVENVENDDGIEADNNQDYKWRGDDNEQVKCFVIVCLSAERMSCSKLYFVTVFLTFS